MEVSVDLAGRRKQLGLTQDELCRRVGISRQTLSSIERASEQPRVALALRIAEALGVTVEEIFGGDSKAPTIDVQEPLSGVGIYGEIGDRLVVRAMPSSPIDGLWQVPNGFLDPSSHLTRLGDPSVLIDGCDPILGIVTGYLSRRVGGDFNWWSLPNAQSLSNLSAGRSHLCLVHAPVGEPPSPLVDASSVLFPLVRWDLCVATKAGNPLQITTIEDLFRDDVSFAQRVKGSGIRQLSDRYAEQVGFVPAFAESFDSHLSACNAVRFGNYDATLTMAPVAAATGLDWTPVGEQQSWLIVGPSGMELRRIRDSLSELSSFATAKILGLVPNYRSAS